LKIKTGFFDYLSVLKYGFIFLFFVVFNMLGKSVMPYSIAPFFAFLALGANLIATPIIFVCSFLALGEVGLLLSSACISILALVITIIHKNFSSKITAAHMLYSLLLGMIFVLIGNTENQIDLFDRLMVSLICTILSFLCYYAIKAVSEKGLKFKLGLDELACACGKDVRRSCANFKS
jgi:hypothetical protein